MGQDQPPDVSLLERVTRLEQVVEKMVGTFLPHVFGGPSGVPQELVPNYFGEQIGPVPVHQIKEEVSERNQHARFGREPFEKDGRQYFEREDPKDLVTYPPSTIDQPGDCA